MRKLIASLLTLAAMAVASPAMAHFQMVYTPEVILEKGGTLDFRLVFTHPFEAGHTMDMGTPQEFYMVHQFGEDATPKKTDLSKALKPITWKSLTNSGKAFKAETKIRSMGDYVFVLVPEVYHDKDEDAYMQQITKVVINVGGVPGNWDKPVGLPCEIVPLDKPYGVWAGNVFRGQVLSEGKPVPGATVEVELLNHAPDMDKNAFAEAALVNHAPDVFVTQTIKADEQGMFTYGIPKAGWWGFAALGVGPVTSKDGKELSQDAVLWIKALDMH